MQDEFMTPEQWSKAIRKSAVTSSSISTGRTSSELDFMITNGKYSYIDLDWSDGNEQTVILDRDHNVAASKVRCRTCHGTGSDGWQACQSCGGSGQVEGVFEPYD